LISKPTWKLKISGHTDNVGSDAYNMTLSKNRAQSTANYLTGKGVKQNQLMVEWFGESVPVADNNTAEGRQVNRRVEMQVVFN
jgi:outer membrane protein OmpA-like peptidoglycan-associated protein